MDSALSYFIRWISQFGLRAVQTKKQWVRADQFLLSFSLVSTGFFFHRLSGAVVQPLPTAYLIFRAPSQAAGKCWMDALELSLRCSALLLRSTAVSSGSGNHAELVTSAAAETETMTHETQWSEADYEKHFYDHGKLF